MKSGIKLRLYWLALVIFWLFAVYSTSIWKSFDQRLTVSVMQNIETVKAFNTFLDDTIIASTQKILENTEKIAVPMVDEQTLSEVEWEDVEWVVNEIQEEDAVALPTLDTLKTTADDQVKLVDQWTKRIQLRNNYVLFRSQLRNLFVALFAVVLVFFLPLWWLKNKKFVRLVFLLL